MDNSFIEQLVKRKNRVGDLLLCCMLLGLSVGVFAFGFLTGLTILWLPALVLGFVWFVVRGNSHVEYEYCYCDKELTIDKICNQSRRKRVQKLDLGGMELMAPYHSHELDSYKNREGKELDYSTGELHDPDTRYMLIADGGKKIIFEPNEALIKAIHGISPRKVFIR
ncbi:MAG: DUF6106 family protein [Lachnospiraceae bacterium]